MRKAYLLVLGLDHLSESVLKECKKFLLTSVSTVSALDQWSQNPQPGDGSSLCDCKAATLISYPAQEAGPTKSLEI